MTLWFVLALMTAAAIFAVLWPLARRDATPVSGSDLAVYRDQLDEVRRDQAAGLIGSGEAQAAQVEISRRLIAAADSAAAAPQAATQAVMTRRRRMVAAAALIVLPAGALTLYLAIGSPLMSAQQRVAMPAPSQEPSILQLVAKIEAHLAQNPDEGRGWEVLAPVYLRMGRFDDAVRACRNALRLLGPSSERHAGLGEALTAAANGVVTEEALAAFKAALAIDQQHVKARFFLGLAAEQDGRIDDAVTTWRALLDNAPADAPWADMVRGELVRVAAGPAAPGGPSEDQIAAAANLTSEQRTAMVKAMVERLAERLRKDGSDFDGWLRLVRSYMVLGDRDRAAAAADDARRAFAGDAERLKRLDELVKRFGLGG